jgi:hypothetical protein
MKESSIEGLDITLENIGSELTIAFDALKAQDDFDEDKIKIVLKVANHGFSELDDHSKYLLKAISIKILSDKNLKSLYDGALYSINIILSNIGTDKRDIEAYKQIF